ncbi:MAG TPA: ABC-F family ATP-binding cassette domain-containing protein [Galbitalea sp.]|nr:ABC-F family ATP-binding cassette domain-containing protein [Galbitalea sp.]
MAHLLGAESLHLEYPTRVVFDSVTIGLDEGQRIGVVGRNGDGKSSLLRLLSGRLEPDGGRVTRRNGITLGMLDQADELPDDLVVSHAIVGDRPEHEWAGDARVRDVIEGLVGGIPWSATVGELSGGQRRRVALAALLVGDWDILFLDEPTNHLDVEGIAWLAAHLKRRWSTNAGGLIVVTHDRWFLDEICTDTWEVHDRIIEPFEGGYAAYILQRVERDRMAAASESKRQNLMRKELAWLRRGAPARSTKPKFRMDAAYELIENEPPPRDTVSLAAMAMQRLGKDVVDIVDVSVSYADAATGSTREVLKDVTWLIAPGERTGILGVNGAGKSTLLGLVSGEVHPTTGKVKRGKTIKVSFLTQQLAELEDIWEDRVSDVLGRQKSTYVSGGKEMTPTQLLERVGFQSAQLSTRVKELSGGQKRRLQLLLIILDEPNVLILDEPTNDLDTDMLAAIEDLLDSFAGTLLVVSHDRYLIERVTDQQYAVLGGHFQHLPRGVEQYLELRSGQLKKAASAGPSTGLGIGAGSGTGAVSGSGLKGAELRNAEKEFAAAGRKIEKLQGQIGGIHLQLAEHDQSDYAGLGSLSTELRGLEASLADIETRWLELSELLG